MRKNYALGLAAAAIMSVSAVGFVAAQQSGTAAPTTEHPYLGVALSDVDAGVEVMSVAADSPAASAGLQDGDIITAINGTTIDTPTDARDAVAALSVGDTVTLDILRSGDAETLSATLEAAPADYGTTTQEVPGRFFLEQNGDMAVQYDPTTNEWTITALAETSPLYTAGLREGDVITAIDGEARQPLDAMQYLAGLADDATVTLSVTRDGASQDITVQASDLDFLRVGRFDMQGMMGQLPFGDDNDQRGGQMMPGMPFDGQQGFGFGQVVGGVRLGVAFEQSNDGATVTQVLDGSAAADAGIQVGDVITAVNGEPVNEATTLRERINLYGAGDTITITLTRDGASQDVSVTLPEAQDMAGVIQGMMPGMNGQSQNGRQGGQRGFQQGGAPNGNGVPAAPNGMNVPAQPDTTTTPADGASA